MDPVDPHLFVIFGATGDLTRRKLIPSIFRVMTEDGVAAAHNLLGVSRSDWSDDEFRQYTNQALHTAGYDGSLVEDWCAERVFYQQTERGATDLDSLRERIEAIEARGVCRPLAISRPADIASQISSDQDSGRTPPGLTVPMTRVLAPAATASAMFMSAMPRSARHSGKRS